MELTKEEVMALMPLLDAGVRGLGVQIFSNNGGVLIQSVIVKLQAVVDKKSDDPKTPDRTEEGS